MAQEYAILDKAATASETYLKNRKKHLEAILSEINESAEEKEAENQQLDEEIKQLESQIDKDRDTSKDNAIFEIVDNQPQRLQRIMRRNRMISKIKDQEEIMLKLQEQLDNYMHRSFPSLG